MKHIAFFTVLWSVIFISSCTITPDRSDFSSKVEDAHNIEAFKKHEALAFDIVVAFGGNEYINGRMTLSTDSRKGLIDLADGSQIYYTDSLVYHSKNHKAPAGVRFHAYTWSYFFLLPYKLKDGGANLVAYSHNSLNGKAFNTQKLTFAPNIGDAPDDWYVLYANKENYLLEYAAYIVTAHASKAEAEKDPHAIQYSDFETIDGVPYAKDWSFWGWNENQGITNQLGIGSIRNIELTDLSLLTQ